MVDNNSTQTGCDLAAGGLVDIVDVKYNVPNTTGCEIRAFTKGCILRGIHFVGGGSSTGNGLVVNTDNHATDLIFSGQWSTAIAALSIQDNTSIVTNVTFNHDTNKTLIDFRGMLSNVFSTQQPLDITLASVSGADGSQLNNINLFGGTLDTVARGKLQINNVISIGGTLDLSDASSANNLISNCKFDGALTVAGDRNKLSNCDFIGGASVSSGADNNGFVNCQFGADAGGGALTLTVVAGSNNTRIVSCMTDAAISDGGTGTTTSSNIVY